MSSENFSFDRLVFLEKENQELKAQLKQVCKERDFLRIRNGKLCDYSCKIEQLVDKIDSKIAKFKGKACPIPLVLHGVKAITDVPDMDVIAEISEEDVIAYVPEIDVVADVLKTDVIAEDPEIHAITEIPEIQAITEVPEIQTITEIPEINEKTDVGQPGCSIKQNKNEVKCEELEVVVEEEEDDKNEAVPCDDLSNNYFFTDKQLEKVHHILGPFMKKKVKAADEATESDDLSNVFNGVNLNKDLLRAVKVYGFEKIHYTELTSIIPVLLEGLDVVVEDPFQPGNQVGKIATIALIILQLIDPSLPSCQALILVPNHVIADKVHKMVKRFGKFMNVTSHVCIGGGTRLRTERKLFAKGGIQIAVGTPGRVADLIGRKCILIENIKHFILAEASDLLSRDYISQMEKIFKKLPNKIQGILFTPKITAEVTSWCNRFIEFHSTIHIKEVSPNLKGVKQFYLNVDVRDWKWKPILDIRRRLPNMRTVIICNGRENAVELLKYQLRQKGQNVLATHTSMKPEEREAIVKQFYDEENAILVTTEFLIDNKENSKLHNVVLLINYELPIVPQNYYTRISFCGPKFEANGVVLNLISGGSHTQLELIGIYEKTFHTRIVELPVMK